MRKLGSGAMSDVFEAEHVRLGIPVALKILRSDDPSAVRRFRAEAKVLTGLSSEHVVRVFDCCDVYAEQQFFVMERLFGEDLRQTLRQQGALPVVRALQLALHVCRGLSAIHRAGIVHRDIKPSNLFLTRNVLGTETCKILDLGVARSSAADTTQDGAVIGTLRYMAPEQLLDGRSVSPLTDLYATAAVLYECLSGVPPHVEEGVESLMFAILNRDPCAPSVRQRALSSELDDLVMAALSRSPRDRPQSIFEWAETIERCLMRLRTSLPGANS
jgi:eukaryotic-like serine/threonine-protein kinase